MVYNQKWMTKQVHLSVWSMIHTFINAGPWFLFFIAIEHISKTELN